MIGSILSLAMSLGILTLAALVIGQEVMVRWALISKALNHRDPCDVRMQRSPSPFWQSAA